MSSGPLVSIICLCYNHARFVEEAVQSVIQQTYKNIEIIMVDDASTDNSKDVINGIVKAYPQIKFLPLEKNIGNCAAFNLGFSHAFGDFIIDMATDDVLLPERVEKGVSSLRAAGSEFGLDFTNAEIINESGNLMSYHYPMDGEGKSKVTVPSGDVFANLLGRYFICPPTMMYTRQLVEFLGGYDETLTYEDFDLWIRSSRKYKYAYTDEVLVKRRVVKGSKSYLQFKIGSPDLRTTYKVMQKAKALLQTEEENVIFRKRVFYEIKVAVRYLNFSLARDYYKMLRV
ncbi:glycosyltransferase family 2 protein [Fulvivirga ligni]|uniref:glycosyltransferase family 2 protein n=1 Tax=Fulvivirga ligni TaxID=2904246 RepID=UPI001F3CF5C2|nr:glycosyltransferase [Fulvivirga ligni]UII23073.1 glycosyltransferase [Fulvivirga ligni]